MAKNKVGRNSPCPCGSGKKYKKCCLNKDDSRMVYEHAKQELLNKMINFLYQERFKDGLNDLFGKFAKMSDSTEHEVINSSLYSVIVDIALFDTPLEDNKKAAEIFYEEESQNLPNKEKEMLSDWFDSTLGIYEVENIVNKEWHLKNMLYDEHLVAEVVEDDINNNAVSQWDLLIARLFKVGGQYQILGSYCNMPSSVKQNVTDLLNTYMADYRQKHENWTMEQFLRDNSLEIAIIPDKMTKAHKAPQEKDDVERLLIGNMGGFYSKMQIEEAIDLWNDFSRNNKKYIGKPEKWAAAIEYIVSRLDLRDITKEKIAEKYGISPRMVVSRANIIESTLTINF